MGENILVIVGVALIAFVLAFLMSLLTSERIRRHGLGKAISSEFSPSSRLNNPYKG